MTDQPTLFNFLVDQYTRESSFYFIFCGMNRTGKSHATKLILEALRSREPRQLVIASDPEDDTWTDRDWETRKLNNVGWSVITI